MLSSENPLLFHWPRILHILLDLILLVLVSASINFLELIPKSHFLPASWDDHMLMPPPRVQDNHEHLKSKPPNFPSDRRLIAKEKIGHQCQPIGLGCVLNSFNLYYMFSWGNKKIYSYCLSIHFY